MKKVLLLQLVNFEVSLLQLVIFEVLMLQVIIFEVLMLQVVYSSGSVRIRVTALKLPGQSVFVQALFLPNPNFP